MCASFGARATRLRLSKLAPRLTSEACLNSSVAPPTADISTLGVEYWLWPGLQKIGSTLSCSNGSDAHKRKFAADSTRGSWLQRKCSTASTSDIDRTQRRAATIGSDRLELTSQGDCELAIGLQFQSLSRMATDVVISWATHLHNKRHCVV